MTVAFKELAGSPLETYTPAGVQAQRRILCAWEDRQAMVGELLGSGYSLGVEGHAPYPGNASVIAMQVKIEPFEARPDAQAAFSDIRTHINSYSGQYAELTITYDVLDASPGHENPPETEPGTFLSYRMAFSSQHIELPTQGFRWQSSAYLPVPPEAVPPVRVPLVEHHLTWHRVGSPPWTTIRQCVGCVNSESFLGAAAETVLFEGVTADKEFAYLDETRAPNYAWKLHYVFKEKAVKYGTNTYGWNHAFRSLPHDAPGFDRLTDPDGNGLYAAVGFSDLFLFEATGP